MKKVAVTERGTKYHEMSCGYLKGKDLKKMNQREAEEVGYEPCKNCVIGNIESDIENGKD